MNQYQHGFKNEFIDTVFRLSAKTWWKMTGINTLMTLLILLIALLGATVFSVSLFDFQNSTNPQELVEQYQQFIVNAIGDPAVITFIAILFVIAVVAGSWSYVAGFKLSDEQIKLGETDFVRVLRSSLSGLVWLFLLATIIQIIISIALSVVVGVLGSMAGILAFIGMIGLFIVMLRLILVFPAIVLGNMSIKESFLFSLQYITFLKSLKLFGILILVFIVLIIVSLILGVVSSIFTLIPVVGAIINIGVNILFGGYLMALTLAALSGLYYRYADIDEKQKELDINDLLISE